MCAGFGCNQTPVLENDKLQNEHKKKKVYRRRQHKKRKARNRNKHDESVGRLPLFINNLS